MIQRGSLVAPGPRARWWAWLVALVIGSLIAGVPVAAWAQPHDDQAAAAPISPPMRLVSLLPSLTEAVCALDACDRLVAVDRYSDWPDSVRYLPVVGGGLDPDIEAIVALKPDLVLAATSSRANDRLRALGIPVLAFNPQTRADVTQVMRQVADRLQLESVGRVLTDMDAAIDAAAASLPMAARGQRVYFEVSAAPYAAGPDSFVGELLQAVGLENIIDPALGPFPKINPELVIREQPDLIMIGGSDRAEMVKRPGWAGLQAFKDGHVCTFSASERNALVRPGPRMGEAAGYLVRCAAAQVEPPVVQPSHVP